MLFIFNSVEPRAFWMKNTYISLDIIFVDKDRRVVNIAENTTPLSRDIHRSMEPARYVVEVNGGVSRRFNIEKGSYIRWDRK